VKVVLLRILTGDFWLKQQGCWSGSLVWEGYGGLDQTLEIISKLGCLKYRISGDVKNEAGWKGGSTVYTFDLSRICEKVWTQSRSEMNVVFEVDWNAPGRSVVKPHWSLAKVYGPVGGRIEESRDGRAVIGSILVHL
jgi:hypothetical protein